MIYSNNAECGEIFSLQSLFSTVQVDIFLVLQEHRLSPIVLEREVLGEVDRWINTYFFH